MLKNIKKRSEGFTIIEVLIVLAIAGLILLIVFLAVPALQRNSRNTQRKDDVARIGGAVQEVLNNNNGDLTQLTNANIQAQLGNLAYYQNANVTYAGAGTATVTNATTTDNVKIYSGAVCAAMTGGQGETKTGATVRNIAITYSVETGGGTNKNCSEE